MGRNKTFYIRGEFEDRMGSIDSPLINKLLQKHFGQKITAEPTTSAVELVVEKAAPTPRKTKAFEPIELDTVDASSKITEKACCKMASPCRHWTWNGVEEVWENTLSGRKRTNV